MFIGAQSCPETAMFGSIAAQFCLAEFAVENGSAETYFKATILFHGTL